MTVIQSFAFETQHQRKNRYNSSLGVAQNNVDQQQRKWLMQTGRDLDGLIEAQRHPNVVITIAIIIITILHQAIIIVHANARDPEVDHAVDRGNEII